MPSATVNTFFGSSWPVSFSHLVRHVRSLPLKRAVVSFGVTGSAFALGSGLSLPSVSQGTVKRAKVIFSYGPLSPHSYRQPADRSGRAARHEYAAGPACSSLATGQVSPSS